jgi:hypothetical protein
MSTIQATARDCSIALIEEAVDVDSEIDALHGNFRPLKHFAIERGCQSFHNRLARKEAPAGINPFARKGSAERSNG